MDDAGSCVGLVILVSSAETVSTIACASSWTAATGGSSSRKPELSFMSIYKAVLTVANDVSGVLVFITSNNGGASTPVD